MRVPQGAPLFLDMEIDVEKIIAQVIEDKVQQGVAPAQCDLHDILRNIIPGITDAMRQLAKQGKYQGAITINKIPVLRRKG